MAKEFHTWSIKFTPVLPAREVAVAYLNECGFSMFEPNGSGVVAHGEVEEVDVAEAESRLAEIGQFAEVECDKRIVPQENWNAQWESSYPKVDVLDANGSPRCTIRAPFHVPPEAGIDVVVAPQMSFGTGHHATTHLMTEALLGLDLKGTTVLDMGCGTGVLAIVAAKTGASHVMGIDIEHDAVVNSQDNVALNPDVSDVELTFAQGDGTAFEAMDAESWDVLCANIHKNVLMDDMHHYARTLRCGGSLLLSGFFEGDVVGLEECVVDAGLSVVEVNLRDGWACMHCGKPSM